MRGLLLFVLFVLCINKAFPQSGIRASEVKNPALLTVSSARYDKYQLKDFVRAGASVRLGNELDRFEVKEIIRLNPALVTVIGTRFDKYDMKDFVRLGASVVLTSKFDRFDVKEIIALNPSLVSVQASGFDKFALNEFTRAGARVVEE